jgi:hypothetical protein
MRKESNNIIMIKGFWSGVLVFMGVSAIAAITWLIGLNMAPKAAYLEGYYDHANGLPIDKSYRGRIQPLDVWSVSDQHKEAESGK